ncbi:phage tail assembly chaperone [Lentilactobacillus buchneri]|jgi:predicted dienelactone hydrolase|uniref:phage tail assembly chaperone n=1 Tax=Lentilactobacillus buchneri TaxID=1581 RepID=UPI0012916ED0|nr:hypothetical protein [Lentilactobacillus buchneri]MCI1922636.1 hypothetical protein [Lentilactobacillus buchneri]MCI1950668.1 hypothetical protein [Lentilactobacillus buchneri]MCI2018255.1 hypothetical protein [Lentilactobacillus buchneri]MCI2027794.1 hypothetical protein [Lentilactobacillus buchneri]MQM78866.1 hypothetical protein [Lentilactobacillus buchneri]
MAQVNISDFLAQNVSNEPVTEEVHFKRFKSPFIIKEITNDESDELTKQATKRHVDKRTRQVVEQTDATKYAELLVVASVVQPNLNSAELQKSYGTMGKPVETLKKMLKFSELNELTQRVTDLVGVNNNLDDDVDTVKK